MKDAFYEPLAGLDAWFLYAERQEAPLHIGATYIPARIAARSGGTSPHRGEARVSGSACADRGRHDAGAQAAGPEADRPRDC